MILYAESSAVLAWLLGEPAGERVRRALIEADMVMSSDLTLVECDRAIERGVAVGAIEQPVSARLKSRFESAAANWNVLRILPQIIARACEPFPGEPIRTLDAIHVASALHVRATLPRIALLALDNHIRKVGSGLGFPLLPA
ncbi:MAG TPA: type II toxin-antitoxin system VapC family toxin [Rhizomicrobium sp.]|nr:type II toxin-antitoxin system VapC family toxin [Rhizomicrobium sp.]